MFSLMPLWWLLGGLYLCWGAFAIILAIVLLTSGKVVLPTGSVLWLMLIGLIVVSATRMEKATGFFMYGLRLAFVLSAFLVYLYVYNAARSSRTRIG